MATPTYPQLVLRWQPDARQNRAFNLLATALLGTALALGLLLSAIPVPQEERSAAVTVPERIARFITEQPRPPAPAPRPEPVKPPPPPPPSVEPQVTRPPPAEREPLTQAEQQARERAAQSGLLGLARELASLSDSSGVRGMIGAELDRGTQAGGGVDTTVLSAAGAAAGNRDARALQGAAVGGSRLDAEQRRVGQNVLAQGAESLVAEPRAREARDAEAGRRGSTRSEAEVAYVMDRHKGVLHSVYRQARRSNPGLQGKIVLELTILPSGAVAEVRIQSSELGDEALERRLVARIMQLDFGARGEEPLTIVVPVEFMPS